MNRGTSKGGTSISYERSGRGPAVILVGGGLVDPVTGRAGRGDEFFEQAADAIAASMPRAERRVIEGQTHVVDPKAFAPVLERFFRECADAE